VMGEVQGGESSAKIAGQKLCWDESRESGLNDAAKVQEIWKGGPLMRKIESPTVKRKREWVKGREPHQNSKSALSSKASQTGGQRRGGSYSEG